MTWCALDYRSFDVRRECLYREYFYLLPAETIGIKDGCSSEEVQEHISEFNSVLKGFEVCGWSHVSHWFWDACSMNHMIIFMCLAGTYIYVLRMRHDSMPAWVLFNEYITSEITKLVRLAHKPLSCILVWRVPELLKPVQLAHKS